ncbi:MAG: sulfatase/phosphatase domain-containing protein, partial [Verrucomicrobiota bacterium]
VYPTLCELAGIPIPDHTEGTSLVPVLENPKSSVKEAAFSQFTRRLNDKRFMGYAMRTNTHRYIEWIDRQTKESVATELYDHRKDPHETTNVASNPKNKELLTQLHNQLWTALPDPPDFKPATPKKQRPQLRFENNLNEPVTVFWLRPDGPRRESGQIAPGKSLTSNTTLGHRFLIKGTQSDFTQTVTVTKQNETVSLAALKKKATKAQSGEASRFPNILILMADDWSYPHAAALGDPTVHTPTFDRIAREGALFENAFVSAPSCTPSRHAVSSGQYHWRPGVGADLGSSMAAHIPVYPDLLADAGYITGFSRKGTGPSKHTHRGNDPFGPKFESFEAFYHQRDPFQPFCFWYGAGEPHRPYRLGEGIEKGIDLASIVIPPGLPDNETVRSDLADYYARVQRFDADAARMIALLEEAGELENTIVVMTGDNGMPFPRCKGTLYDMGTRVPLAIRWGAHLKNPGRTISGFTSLTDLAPTFLEAAKLDGPAEMTGQSLMPTLLGAQSTSRDFVLTGLESHVYPRPRRALRTEDFLLIRNFSPKDWPTGEVKGKQPRYNFNETPWPTTPGAFSFAADPGPTKQWMLHHRDGPEAEHHYQLAFGSPPEWELYDLKEDPGQLHNVADHPDYKSQFQILRQQLAEGLQASGDSRRIDGNTEATWERRTQNLKGWTIYSNESLWQNNPDVMKRAMEIISLQLDRVLDTVPPAALKKLQEVPLYINPPYPETRGKAEYHPHAGWLRKNNRDPAMAKAVEFTNARILPFENKRMPYVVLHELAHAYHDQVLGFDHPEIKAAYERAKNSGTYNQVKRWTGTEETIDKAYAMSTPQEYFAESTEAFFGKNDFYPFTREELKKHDPAIHDLLDKLWNSTHTSGNDR